MVFSSLEQAPHKLKIRGLAGGQITGQEAGRNGLGMNSRPHLTLDSTAPSYC